MLPQLIILVTAAHAGAVGFGEVYTCQVQSVLVGTLTESTIRLTVLANDKKKIRFLATHQPPQEIELGFRIARGYEQYSLVPITGFVDAGRNSWELVYLREGSR